MSIFMGVNGAVEDLLFCYTTVVYPGDLGFNCNAVAFASWFLVSLLLASPVAERLRSKNTIVLGLTFSCMQYSAFVVCSALPDVWYMHWLAYAGAVCAGMGVGFSTTAEGVFFAE